MKKLVLIALFYPLFGYSQNALELIATLKNELKANPDQKRTATIYSDLTWYYSNVSIDSALTYGRKAIHESEITKDSTLIAQVYSDVGAVYFRKGDYNDSKKSYLKAYSIRKKLKDENGMAKVNINLASIYVKKQEYQLGLKNYLDGIKYFEAKGNQAIVADAKSNVGLLFYEMKNYKKSIQYLKEAIPFQEANKVEDKLCNSYLTLGIDYLQLKDTINALAYFDKSLKIAKKIGHNLTLSSAYNNIGAIKTAQNKSKEALDMFKKSKSVRKDFNAEIEKASLNLNFSKELIKEKKFVEAQKMLLEGKKIFESKKTKDKMLLTYNQLITVYANLKIPDSADFYLDKYITLNNQLFEENNAKQISELDTKYQTAKKEKLILKKDAENKRKTMWIMIISILAAFTSLIGFLIYRQQKIKNKQQEQEYQLKSAIAQIETQNKLQEQRLSISRDLHDNIGAQLTFVISSVDNLKFGNQITDNKISNQLTKISDFTKSTIVELRDTIWAMNTNEFSFEDLRSRIFNFIEKAKTASEAITFNFEVDDSLQEEKFSSIVGINLYRTIQEAVNNALKYSDAESISVKVASHYKKIKIEIHDNGKGFNIDKVAHGNGLNNMVKRIEEIGGTCEIDSHVKQGTTIRILISKTH